MARDDRADPGPPARPRHGADARPHAAAAFHRGRRLRRRRDPRQPDALARHLRRARPGGDQHLEADAVSGGDQSVHAPPRRAGGGDADRPGGRRLEDLEIVWAVRVGTAASTAEARRLARPTAVHWGVLRWGGHWVEPAGLRLPKFEIPEAVSKIYPDLSHAHDWEAAIAATSFVPDDVVAQLCDALGLVGTPADCAARIVEMTKLGVRNLYLMPLLTFGLPEPEIAAFREVVFPRLREAGLRGAR